MEHVDTFDGVFTRDLGGDPLRTATANISLTHAQMAAVFQAIQDVGSFELPSTFKGVPEGLSSVGFVAPAPCASF